LNARGGSRSSSKVGFFSLTEDFSEDVRNEDEESDFSRSPSVGREKHDVSTRRAWDRDITEEEDQFSQSKDEEEEDYHRDAQQRISNLKHLVTSHHIGLAIGLSIASIASGVLLIFVSLGVLSPKIQFIVNALISTQVEHSIFLAIGVVLIIIPLFLNRFVFNALRYERELRLRAERSAREAQLLQDILAHDIRNYNQVAKLSADLISEEFRDNKGAMELITALQSSIEGSTQLVDRAKMLGKIISDLDHSRYSVNALDSINRSISIVTAANPEKSIQCVCKVNSSPAVPLGAVNYKEAAINVLADGLLDQVFVNLFSNSVKYTEGEQVFISIEIEREKGRADFWKISISDLGKGIPDDLKRGLFSRYLEGAKGSGLGMSIVHALTVGRYGGKIRVKDRQDGDYTKGTTVQLWLPAA
jgi:signal transduction histidine kinase